MSAYFWIIIGTIFFPFILSFDKKVHFYTYWKYLFPAIFFVSIPFLIWDFWFTYERWWGFTQAYLQGVYLFNLPIEECLFFIFVPYAGMFIYEVLKAYFPKVKLEQFTAVFAYSIFTLSLIILLFNLQKPYSILACSMSLVFVVYFYFIKKVYWFKNFAFMFLVLMMPFMVINGLLTGGVSAEPVVWYKEYAFSTWRIWTIPIEDICYNFDMFILIVFFYESLKEKKWALRKD